MFRLYPVDKSRTNEYGMTFEEDANTQENKQTRTTRRNSKGSAENTNENGGVETPESKKDR